MVGQSSGLNETPFTQPSYEDTKTDESSSEQIFAVQQPIILVVSFYLIFKRYKLDKIFNMRFQKPEN